jgi:hypothetical protein
LQEPATATSDEAELATEEPSEDEVFAGPSPEEFVVRVDGLFAARKRRWRPERSALRARRTGRDIHDRLIAHPRLAVAGAFAIALWVLLGTLGILADRHTTLHHTASPRLIARSRRPITHTEHAPGARSLQATRPARGRAEIARPAVASQSQGRPRAKAQPQVSTAPVERTPVVASEPVPPPATTGAGAAEQTSGGLFSP